MIESNQAILLKMTGKILVEREHGSRGRMYLTPITAKEIPPAADERAAFARKKPLLRNLATFAQFASLPTTTYAAGTNTNDKPRRRSS